MQENNPLDKLKKKIVFYLIMLAIVLGVIECISFAYFSIFHERYTFFNYDNYLLPAEDIARTEKIFDAELGWDNHYDTKYGERKRDIDYKEDLISTFGESHTHCDQVDDDETWQYYLSNILKKNVYNFGVGAYGTDQAYLRYKRDYQKVNTPIVTLGLTSENLNRIVNVYRPFYSPNGKNFLTKPRFILDNNKLRLLSNPIQSKKDIWKLGDEDFIKSIKNDYWSDSSLPSFSFPYTSIFFNKNFYDETINGKFDDLSTRKSKLWNDAGTTNLLFRIFDAFVDDAKSKKATPIIMILPLKYEVVNLYEKETIVSHDKILEYCKIKNYLCFDGTKSLAQAANSKSDIESFYKGHASAEGNEVTAKGFYSFLQENKLVE